MARKAKTVTATAPTAMDVTVTAIGADPAPETITVRSHRVACDGVGGALGHPRVWLELGAAGFVDCPYCDRRFVLAGGAADHGDLPKADEGHNQAHPAKA